MSAIVGRNLLQKSARALPRASLLRASAAAKTFSLATPRHQLASQSIRSFSLTMSPHSGAPVSASQAPYDKEIQDIADYVLDKEITSPVAIDTARLILLDTIGCGFKGLEFEECQKLMGPEVPGMVVPHGATVPGTNYVLQPTKAAFNIGSIIRWIDQNDCWLAAEWGHPSDNFGAIGAVADWMTRTNKAGGNAGNGKTFTVKDVLIAMIRAHEIQGCLALENSFNRHGLDHVALVKIASTAVVAEMLGLDKRQTCAAISHAFIDGQSLRTYRHSPNAMARKSWAAGDACERAVNLALKVKAGEDGIPSGITTPVWGFNDVLWRGKSLQFQRPYGSYVMENILFKVSYPAEFHAQSAVEAAETVNKKLEELGKTAEDIESIKCRTHEAAIRIIDKQFKVMENYADRDHTLQFMVATMLVFKRLTAEDYIDGSEAATSELLKTVHQKIECVEDPAFTADYHDPSKRYISNGLTVTLKDGTVLDEVVVEAPIGHASRRKEATPRILKKFENYIKPALGAERAQQLLDLHADTDKLYSMSFDEYMDLYTVA